MRGFNDDMIQVDAALEKILSSINKIGDEDISIANALGRVLAEDLISRVDHPPNRVSAMDGYAVRSKDINSPPPVRLKQVGESSAGNRFNGLLKELQTIRIFTGARIPENADTIIIQENVIKEKEHILIQKTEVPGKYIRQSGLDFKKGDVLLKSGTRLNFRNIALIAAMNIAWIKVTRKPRIAIFSSGSELVYPGDEIGPDQIISSNSIGLSALIEASGGSPINLGIAIDDMSIIRQKLSNLMNVDLLVTIGGASVGDYDLIRRILGEAKNKIKISRVAMRPGKPLIFGKLQGIPILGLPGNPVSAGVTAILYLVPAINKLVGSDNYQNPIESAITTINLEKNDSRQDYLRAKLSRKKNGELSATPFNYQDSSMLLNFAKAECLIIRAPFAKALKKGNRVKIIRLDYFS
mgnify:FL=1|tara:strand:+ start:14581 stop:15810 length:1230 start_codon:yes stop_codon:yes gene_type:complete